MAKKLIETDMQTDRHADRQTCRQTDMQTDRQTERFPKWFLVLHFAAKNGVFFLYNKIDIEKIWLQILEEFWIRIAGSLD